MGKENQNHEPTTSNHHRKLTHCSLGHWCHLPGRPKPGYLLNVILERKKQLLHPYFPSAFLFLHLFLYPGRLSHWKQSHSFELWLVFPFAFSLRIDTNLWHQPSWSNISLKTPRAHCQHSRGCCTISSASLVDPSCNPSQPNLGRVRFRQELKSISLTTFLASCHIVNDGSMIEKFKVQRTTSFVNWKHGRRPISGIPKPWTTKRHVNLGASTFQICWKRSLPSFYTFSSWVICPGTIPLHLEQSHAVWGGTLRLQLFQFILQICSSRHFSFPFSQITKELQDSHEQRFQRF